MFIDGKWYTETEIAAYVQELKNKIDKLENELKNNTDKVG